MRNHESISIALGVALVLFASGCASTKEVRLVRETTTDHAHLNPTAKNAGDFHVASFMDRRNGTIGVQILDRMERPYFIRRSSIDAAISCDGRPSERIELEAGAYRTPPDFQRDDPYSGGSSVFEKKLEWVRIPHDIALRVWVPLPDGNTYELEFTCAASDAAPTHSGLR